MDARPPAFDADPAGEPQRPRRPWSMKFNDALRGLKYGIRGQSSFFVHFFAAALVVAGAIALQCSAVEWAILLLCIGGVLATELINSALEVMHRGLDSATRERNYKALDIGAGAVLLASVTAAIVGAVVFISRLSRVLGWI